MYVDVIMDTQVQHVLKRVRLKQECLAILYLYYTHVSNDYGYTYIPLIFRIWRVCR